MRNNVATRILTLALALLTTVCSNGQTTDYVSDETGKITNSDFSDYNSIENLFTGWVITVSGYKTSVGAKPSASNPIVEGGKTHLQIWNSGTATGTISQTITGLASGKYTLTAAVAPAGTLSGTAVLFAGTKKTALKANTAQVYEVSATVSDGTLDIGFDFKTTSKGNTFDIGAMHLYYMGVDADSYAELLSTRIKQGEQDITAMQANDAPGYNNMAAYQTAIDAAKAIIQKENATVEELEDALKDIDAQAAEYKSITAAYAELKQCISNYQTSLAVSGLTESEEMASALSEAQAAYLSTDDQRTHIPSLVAHLGSIADMMEAYNILNTTIAECESYLATNDYPDKETFSTAIAVAKETLATQVTTDMVAMRLTILQARTAYYESQYDVIPTQQTVSEACVTLVEGEEKHHIKVDGKPFYLTATQVRLDKIADNYNWTDRQLSLLLRKAANDGFNTVSIPVMWVDIEKEKDVFDYTLIDNYMNWCRDYGLKMEVLWFSCQSVGRIGKYKDGTRVPDYVMSLDGTSDYTIAALNNGEYTLSFADTRLRDREQYVLSQLIEHIARWDASNGNAHTVIGFQLGNEARNWGTYQPTADEVIAYYNTIGQAVKNSKYVTYTRMNGTHTDAAGRIAANDKLRDNGGTTIDFVGIDYYRCGDPNKIYNNCGGEFPKTTNNLRMIMECGADESLSPYFQMAALAADMYFNYYTYASVDECLYTGTAYTALTARAWAPQVRQRNKMLAMANEDIATKSNGKSLYVFNMAATSAESETSECLDGIAFKPATSTTQGIAIRRSESEYLLLATDQGTFTMPESLHVTSVETGHIDYTTGTWVRENTTDIEPSTSIELSTTACARVLVGNADDAISIASTTDHAEQPTVVATYNAAGMQTTQPATRGLTIMRMSDGSVRKTFR